MSGVVTQLAQAPSVFAPAEGAAQALILIVAMHVGNILLYATTAHGVPLVLRLISGGALLAITLLAHSLGCMAGLGWVLVTLAYFVLVGLCVHRGAELFRQGALTRGAVFVLCVAAFVLLPVVLFPSAPRTATLVPGWAYSLSAISYVIDGCRGSASPSRRDALFFLFVIPTLVYGQVRKQARNPGLHVKGLVRASLALVAFCGVALMTPPVTEAFDVFTSSHLPPIPGAMLAAALWLIAAYAAHSTAASLRIGLMAQLGYDLPECYHYALLARSPSDFWRRWNVWVGQWAFTYLFSPIARHLRRVRHLSMTWVHAGAMVSTLGFVGAYHDLIPLAENKVLSFHSLQGFCLFSVVGLTWSLLEGAKRRLRISDTVFGSATHVAFAGSALAMIAVWRQL